MQRYAPSAHLLLPPVPTFMQRIQIVMVQTPAVMGLTDMLYYMVTVSIVDSLPTIPSVIVGVL